MAWSDLRPRTRALARGGLFFTLILILSVYLSADAEGAGRGGLHVTDVLIALIGAVLYAGIMNLVEGRVIKRRAPEGSPGARAGDEAVRDDERAS